MEQEDYEEGEILDTEEETETVEDKKEEEVPEPDLDAYNVITRPSDAINSTYRQQKRLISQSDDEDDNSSIDSDEDTDLWKLKKSKYFLNRTGNMDVEISNVIKSPVRPSKNGKTEDKTLSARNIDFGTGEKRKRQNNIWGSVLTEQSLTQTMGSIGVERKAHVVNNYRTVEAYDYLNAFEDERPYEEGTSEKPKSMDPFLKVIDSDNEEDRNKHDKRDKNDSRGYKKRRRHDDHHRGDHKRQKRYRTCNPDDPDDVVVKAIVENLNEDKPYLIERIVGVIGKKKSVELMYATEDVEERGGMKTHDGYRRRTPGGVYIQLIKQDVDVTKDMVDEIFAEEQKKYKKELKKKSRERQREKRSTMKMLPQNSYMNKGNSKHVVKKEEKQKSSDEDEMETGEKNGNTSPKERTCDDSFKSNDEDFLNRSEDQLDVMLGEDETIE